MMGLDKTRDAGWVAFGHHFFPIVPLEFIFCSSLAFSHWALMSCRTIHADASHRPALTLEIKALWPHRMGSSQRSLSALTFHILRSSFPLTRPTLPTQSSHCGQQHFEHFLQMHLERVRPLEWPLHITVFSHNPTRLTKLERAPLSHEASASYPSWKRSWLPI